MGLAFIRISLTVSHFTFLNLSIIFVLVMKKIIASISFLCYLAVTSGVIVNFHYCMNRFASMQWFVAENKNCPTCGMKINKAHGCCRDEVKGGKDGSGPKNNTGFYF